MHALFSCAGVADGTEGIMKINFIAHRHIIDRLVDGGKMPSGSAIGMISSVAGLGWEKNLETLGDFLEHDRLRERVEVDRGARGHRQLLVQQAGDQRVRRA